MFRLRLFVNGRDHGSVATVRALRRRCDREVEGRYELDVVDVLKRPDLAEANRIVATPTLFIQSPIADRKIVGDPAGSEDLFGRPEMSGKAAPGPLDARSLLSLSPDGCVLVDADGDVLFINEAAARMLGVAVEELTGEQFGFPIAGREQTELRLASGSTVDMRTAAIEWEGQEARIVTLRDTTELKAVEAELRAGNAALERQQEELEQSNKDFDEFAHVAAHDLKSPLRQMKLFSELVLHDEGESLSPGGREDLERVVASAGRLSNMIDALLEFAKVGRGELRLSRFDLGELIDDVVVDLREEIEEAGAEVVYDSLPNVEADRDQLYQVFLNLVGNSIKYRRPEARPVVRVSSRDVDDGSSEKNSAPSRREISVEDNGIGFEPEYVDRVFEPFKRLVSSAEYEGSGIGLGTVKKILERHGGTIHAVSRPGEGSTFVAELPRSEVSSPAS